MKILVVDRDEHSRAVFREALEVFGKCDFVEHGKSGLQILEKSIQDGTPYDLVCVDCHLSDRGGFELLEQLRFLEHSAALSENEHARILVMSSLNDPRLAVETFRRGCEALLLKPLEASKITNEIKRLGLLPRGLS